MRGKRHPESPSFPWHTTYLTVAVLSVGLLVGIWSLFPRFRHPSGLPAGLVVVLFTVTSLLHWYDVSDGRTPEKW